MAAKEKVTLYFPKELLEEAKAEALRQDRSLSWILQMAWRVSRDHLQQMPGIEDFTPDVTRGDGLGV
ncbi:unnamed protein product [Laminaria digitata]